MKKLIVLLFYTASFLSCSEENETLQDFKIKVGESFTIELEANWSTGYSWTWENSPEVYTVDTTGRAYIQSDPGLGGGTGTEEWTFVGKSVGKEILKFYYLKANDQDSDPLKKREYLVNVASS
jgi:predicted secreted protein